MKSRKQIISEQIFAFLNEQNPTVSNLRLGGPRSRHWQENKIEDHQQKMQKQAKEMPVTGKLEANTQRTSSVEPEEPTLPDANIPPNLYKREFDNYVRSKYNWNLEKQKTERFQNVSRPLYSSNPEM
jgi:GH18 family chitinase